jgi:proline racemase
MAEVDVEMSSNGSASAEEAAAVTKGKQQTIAEDRPVNDRLLFCAEVLIGYRCTVEVSNMQDRALRALWTHDASQDRVPTKTATSARLPPCSW